MTQPPATYYYTPVAQNENANNIPIDPPTYSSHMNSKLFYSNSTDSMADDYNSYNNYNSYSRTYYEHENADTCMPCIII